MNYFILNKELKTVAIAQTDSSSRNAFHVLEDSFVEYSNAPSTLDLTLDFYNEKALEIKEGAHVVFEYDGAYRLFQIKQVEELHAADSHVKLYAEESSFELLDAVIFPKDYSNQSAEYLLNICLADTDWQVGEVSEINVEKHSFSSYGTALNEAQTLATETECMLRFRIKFSPKKGVLGKYVDLLEKANVDEGKRLEFGRNVDSVQRTVDRTQVCTAVIPIGNNDVLVNGFEWVNNYKDKTITKVKQNYYLAVDEETRNEINPNSDCHLFYPLTVDSDDKSTLCQKAYEHLKNHKEPKITYDVKAVMLNDVHYQIGEKVKIIDDELGISLVAEVEQQSLSFCDPDKNEIVLTNYVEKQANISQKLLSLQNKLQTKPLDNTLIVVSPDKPLIEQVGGEGTVWIDTSQANSNGIVILQKYDITNGEWIEIQQTPSQDKVTSDINSAKDEAISQAVNDANVYAEILSSGREMKILKGETFPESAIEGQLFVHTTTGDMYRWNGTEWVIVGVGTETVKAMEEELEEAKERIAEAKETIAQAKEEIAQTKEELAQAKEDIIGVGNELNTKAGELQDQADDLQAQANDLKTRTSGLEGSVSDIDTEIDEINGKLSVTATKTEVQNLVDGIVIGGRNLLKNTKNTITNENYTLAHYAYVDVSQIVAGETYTVSFDGMLTDATQTGWYINTYPSPYHGCKTITPSDLVLNEWVHYEATFKMPTNNDAGYTSMGFYSYPFGNYKTSHIKNVKLEKGTKATSWTPAVEDTDGKIEANGQRITENTGKINVNAERIESVYSELQSEQTAQGSRLTKAESNITQNANLIASKVGMTEVTNAINDVKVGGRNLLVNTKTDEAQPKIVFSTSKGAAWSGLTWTNEDGILTLYANAAEASKEIFWRFMQPSSDDPYGFEPNTEYVLSGKAKVTTSSGDVVALRSRWQYFYNGAWRSPSDTWYGILSDDSDEWVYFEHKIKTPEVASSWYLSIQLYSTTGIYTGIIQLTELQLEKGNKATNYAPAPEDTQTQLDSQGTRITDAESTIEQHADMIASKVSQTTYETDMNNFETRISNAETTVTQTANSIESVVREKVTEAVEEQAGDIKDEILGQVNSDYTEFQTRLSNAESSIAQKADSTTITAMKNELTATIDASRSSNLVRNGDAGTGDNSNFSSLTYDGTTVYQDKASFKSADSVQTISTSDFITIDTTHIYRLSVNTKASELPKSTDYFGFQCYDIDKNYITAQCYMHYPNSTTTLAKDLKDGDTKIYLTSVAGFTKTATQDYARGLMIWNYTNSKGYTYPAGTYSRNYRHNLWEGEASFNTTENSITLKTAWSHGTIPAGTAVSQSSNGNYFSYPLLSGTGITTEWQHLTANLNGVITNGGYVSNKFRPATAYIRVAFSKNNTNAYYFNNISLIDVTEEINAGNYTDAQVESAKSSFQVTAEEIRGEVSKNKSDISGLQETTTAMNTSIAQNAEAIALRATKTEAQGYVDALVVGTANLYPMSTAVFNDTPVYTTDSKFEFKITNAQPYGGLRNALINLDLKSNTEYRFSFEFKYESGTFRNIGGHNGAAANGFTTMRTIAIDDTTVDLDWGNNGEWTAANKALVTDGKWHKIVVRLVTSTLTDGILNNWYLQIQPNRNYTDETVTHWKNIQLEEGTKVTNWKPCYKDTDERITAAEAAIDVNSEQISLRATKTEMTESIRNLQIGGTNLLRNSKVFGSYWSSNTIGLSPAQTGVVTKDAFMGASSITGNSVGFASGAYFDFANQNITERLEPSTEYTLSFYVKGSGTMRTYVYPNTTDITYTQLVDGVEKPVNTANQTASDGQVIWNLTSDWVRHSVTFRTKDTLPSSSNVLFRVLSNDGGSEATICMPKLEKGNKATDYAICPLDTEVRLSAAEAAITVNAEEIALRATKTELTNTVNALEIGGRNILLDSVTYKGFSNNGTTSPITCTHVKDADGNDLYTRIKSTMAGTVNGISLYNAMVAADFSTTEWAGKKMTFSVDVRTNRPNSSVKMQAYNQLSDNSKAFEAFDWSNVPENKWVRLSVTVDSPTDFGKVSRISLYLANKDGNTTSAVSITDADHYLDIRNLQVEFGSKPTDWNLAPEDVDNRISTAEASIKVNAENIALQVKSIEEANDKITKNSTDIYTNAENIKLSATKTELTNAINNISIGGTNLIGVNDIALNQSTGTYDGDTHTWTLTATAGNTYTFGCGLAVKDNKNVVVPYGKTYICSFEVFSPRQVTWAMDINNKAVSGSNWNGNDNDTGRKTSSTTIPANQWTKCWFMYSNTHASNTGKIDIADYSCFGIVMKNETSDLTFKIRNIMGELGNKPSEWSPCPRDVSDRIHQAEIKIDANTGAIGLRATKTELTNAINNLEVSGRNCLLKSDFDGKSPTGGVWSFGDGIATGSSSTLNNGNGWFDLKTSSYFQSKAYGKTCTLSIEYKVNATIAYGTTQPWIGTQLSYKNSNGSNVYIPWKGNKTFSTAVTSGWVKDSITFEIPANAQAAPTSVNFYFRDATGTIQYRNPMLVIGNKAADWALAPEDTDERLISVEEATLTILPNQISQKVSNSTYVADMKNSSSRMDGLQSQIDTNAKNINLRVTSEEYTNMAIGGYNFLQNADFNDTVEYVTAIPDGSDGSGYYVTSDGTSKHPNIYPRHWGGYNGGVTNAKTVNHAHIDEDTFDDKTVLFDESDGTTNWKGISIITNNFNGAYSQGRMFTGTFTFSCDMYVDKIGSTSLTRVYGGFHHYLKDGDTKDFHGGQYTAKPTVAGKWHRVKAQCTLHADTDFSRAISFYIYGYNIGGSKIWIKNVQLEQGNKATAFGLSGADTQGKLVSLESRLQQAEIDIQKDKIVHTVLESEVFDELFKSKADSDALKDLTTLEELEEKLQDIDFAGKIDQRILEYIDDPESNLNMEFATKSQLVETKNSIQGQFGYANGLNYIHNSLGFGGINDGYWEPAMHKNLLKTNSSSSYKDITISQYWALVTPSRVHYADYGLKAGDWVTFRVYINPKSATKRLQARVSLYTDASGQTYKSYLGTVVEKTTPAYSYISVQVLEDYPYILCGIHNADSGSVTAEAVEQYRYAKLERGKLTTGWSTVNDESPYIKTGYDFDAEPLGFKSSIEFVGKTSDRTHLYQAFPTIVGNTYTFSFYYKAVAGTLHAYVTDDTVTDTLPFTILDEEGNPKSTGQYYFELNAPSNGYQLAVCTFTARSSTSHIKLRTSASAQIFVTGIMVHGGSIPLKWSQASGEQYNTNIQMDINGIKVIQQDDNKNPIGYTEITPKSFSGYYDTDGDGDYEEIFTLREDAVVTKRTVATHEIIMGNLKFINLNAGGYTGWALVPSTANDWSLTEGTEQ